MIHIKLHYLLFLFRQKDYEEVQYFNLASYMEKNAISVMSYEQINQIKEREQLEYIETRNILEVAEKEVILRPGICQCLN